MIVDNQTRCECQVCQEYGPYELRGPHPEFPDKFPADFWPLPHPHDRKRNPNMKYMLIDMTTNETIRFLGVEVLAKAVAWGKIYKHSGHNVIAPPLEGRGFAKLELLQLQYLFWNTLQEIPPEDMPTMITALKAYAEKFPEGLISLDDLEEQVRKLYPEEPKTTSGSSQRAPSAPREPRAPGEAPKATSTTGKVWVIADAVLAQSGHKDLVGGVNIKDLRVAIMKACIAEGINEATAATQYSKWKGSKLAVQTA